MTEEQKKLYYKLLTGKTEEQNKQQFIEFYRSYGIELSPEELEVLDENLEKWDNERNGGASK